VVNLNYLKELIHGKLPFTGANANILIGNILGN